MKLTSRYHAKHGNRASIAWKRIIRRTVEVQTQQQIIESPGLSHFSQSPPDSMPGREP